MTEELDYVDWSQVVEGPLPDQSPVDMGAGPESGGGFYE